MTARCAACSGWGEDCAACGNTGLDRLETERRRKMGRKSRRKGKRGERGVAAVFSDAGIPARRGLQSRGSGEQPDVILDGLEDFYVEVKVGRAPPWRAGYAQAAAAAGTKTAIVVTKRDREPAYAHMALEDLVDLLRELRGQRGR